MRSWVRRLERANQNEQLTILQKDGTVVRFPADAELGAFVHEAERLRSIYKGEDPGEAHPLTVSKRNALYPQERTILDADRQPRRDSEAREESIDS